MESIQSALILSIGSLIAAGFGGFTLLKAFEEFRKGIERKSRIRIWISFSMVMFLFLLIVFLVKN